MTRIPIDSNGYLVEGRTIHTRYATHASGHRTRTAKGVEHLLDGAKGKVCPDCYGKTPRYPDTTPRSPQRRRVAKPETVDPDGGEHAEGERP